MPKALFLVRCDVARRLRKKFDRWYPAYLARVGAGLNAEKAWRFWSAEEGNVHVAVLQFADRARLDAALASDAYERLVIEFDRQWPKGVARTRDIADAR